MNFDLHFLIRNYWPVKGFLNNYHFQRREIGKRLRSLRHLLLNEPRFAEHQVPKQYRIKIYQSLDATAGLLGHTLLRLGREPALAARFAASPDFASTTL